MHLCLQRHLLPPLVGIDGKGIAGQVGRCAGWGAGRASLERTESTEGCTGGDGVASGNTGSDARVAENVSRSVLGDPCSFCQPLHDPAVFGVISSGARAFSYRADCLDRQLGATIKR